MSGTFAEMRPWHKLLVAVLMATVLALAAAFTVVAQSQVQQAQLRADLERAGRLTPAPDPALARIQVRAGSQDGGRHGAKAVQVGYVLPASDASR